MIEVSWLIQQVPVGNLVEIILYVIGFAFSLILISLSISAYRKNPQKKLIYAIAAFSIFGFFLIYENFDTRSPLIIPLQR